MTKAVYDFYRDDNGVVLYAMAMYRTNYMELSCLIHADFFEDVGVYIYDTDECFEKRISDLTACEDMRQARSFFLWVQERLNK